MFLLSQLLIKLTNKGLRNFQHCVTDCPKNSTLHQLQVIKQYTAREWFSALQQPPFARCEEMARRKEERGTTTGEQGAHSSCHDGAQWRSRIRMTLRGTHLTIKEEPAEERLVECLQSGCSAFFAFFFFNILIRFFFIVVHHASFLHCFEQYCSQDAALESIHFHAMRNMSMNMSMNMREVEL